MYGKDYMTFNSFSPIFFLSFLSSTSSNLSVPSISLVLFLHICISFIFLLIWPFFLFYAIQLPFLFLPTSSSHSLSLNCMRGSSHFKKTKQWLLTLALCYSVFFHGIFSSFIWLTLFDLFSFKSSQTHYLFDGFPDSLVVSLFFSFPLHLSVFLRFHQCSLQCEPP